MSRRLLALAIASCLSLAPRVARADDAAPPGHIIVEPGDTTPVNPADVVVNPADVVLEPVEEPPPPCCCRHVGLDHAHRTALAMGLSLLGSGYLLTVAHAITNGDARARQVELIPIAGAIYAETRRGVEPPWSAALMFAAWSQAMGVLVLSIALGPEDRP